MKTRRITIVRPDGQKKTITGTTINGVVARVARRGIGKGIERAGFGPGGDGEEWMEYSSYEDVALPLFSSYMMKEKGLTQADVEKIVPEDKPFESPELRELMFTLGMNPGGYEVYDVEERRGEEVLKGTIPVNFYRQFFGFRMSGPRLPEHLWKKIAHLATYHSATDDEMEFLDDQGAFGVSKEEVRGWYFRQEAMDILKAEGIKVTYRDRPYEGSVEEIIRAIEEEEEKKERREGELKTRVSELRGVIIGAATERATPEEVAAIQETERILIPEMNFAGPTIYGRGEWLHVLGEDLYLVINNGHDGDNWAENNYSTGGAGAVAVKCSGKAHLVDEMKAWLDSLGEDRELLQS